jgi:hypothetical protein
MAVRCGKAGRNHTVTARQAVTKKMKNIVRA